MQLRILDMRMPHGKLTLLLLPFKGLGWKGGREEIPLYFVRFFIILCSKKIFPKFAQLIKILISN